MNMNNKLFLVFGLIIGILFIFPFALADGDLINCQDITFEDQIPCNEITPVLNCSEYTYNITNLTDGNNSLIIENGNLTANGDGTYNYTFNNSVGYYGVILCDGTSGKFNVLPQTQYLFIAIVLISAILLIISVMTSNNIFPIFSGILALTAGFYFFYNNPIITNSFIDSAIPFVFWGIGAYLILSSIIIIIINTYGGEQE